MKSLGFLGFGNMAGAIVGGITNSGILNSENIYIYDVSELAQQKADKLGFKAAKSEKELVKSCEIIFLCVKPQCFTEVLTSIKDVSANKIFVSIAAGKTINSILKLLGEVGVIRAMPNTPLLLKSGTTALTKNQLISENDFYFVKSIFESVGSVYELNENQFDEVINLNGSTPAYLYYFAQIITDFANEHGIERQLAMQIFTDTMIGSAKMLKTSGNTAQELIDMVSSKGGTTVAALNAFKENNFKNAVDCGLEAALKRSVELALN